MGSHFQLQVHPYHLCRLIPQDNLCEEGLPEKQFACVSTDLVILNRLTDFENDSDRIASGNSYDSYYQLISSYTFVYDPCQTFGRKS